MRRRWRRRRGRRGVEDVYNKEDRYINNKFLPCSQKYFIRRAQILLG